MIGGIAGRTGHANAGRFRLYAGFALTLAGLPTLAAAWIPLVELKFESLTTTTNPYTTPNTGSTGGNAAVSSATPALVSNIAISGGTNALDYGLTNTNIYADLTGSTLTSVNGLKSFTIAGWVNCRQDLTNAGGGRIVSWFKSAAGGVDLAFRSGGSLGLGINQYNDSNGVLSNPGKISVDLDASYNNWRFFAVTYDGTVQTNNVKFYFGTNNVPASLDKAVTYNRGPVSNTIAPSLTVGNVPSNHRGAGFYSPFHGLIDQVRIYGDKNNSGGVLTLDQIQSLQGALTVTNVPGVLYEQWNNISGNSLSALTSNSRYQDNNPWITKLQTNFEGFEGSGDNYGARVSGWVKAPTTGSYIFWLIADDAGELRVSTDANPANKRTIASVATFNATNTSWTQYPSQQSEPVELEANQYYYVEALMKQGNGGNFVRVGWQLPSGVQERPIPQSRLVTTPPDGVPFYPSQYPVYEPGTYVKKAAMGWQKETNNDHFYIRTDGTEALKAKDGATIIPKSLDFGGDYANDPYQNDLGFHWERPTVNDVGTLWLETQHGNHEHWAMNVYGWTGVEPQVEFNQFLRVDGPQVSDNQGVMWSSSANIHHANGITFERSRQDNGDIGSYGETSNLNGNSLLLTRSASVYGFPFLDTSKVSAGQIYVSGVDVYAPTRVRAVQADQFGLKYIVSNNGQEESRTVIDEAGLTSKTATISYVYADSVLAKKFVTTPRWKVMSQLPDYVFEKDYELKSLEETERFVKEKKHLPEVPSAKEMSSQGVDLTEMNMKLLKKVEELTLHMIALDKEVKALKAERKNPEGRAAHMPRNKGKGR